MILCRLNNIKKSYGDVDILTDVNLEIKEKQVLGLVGLNGAGKTTIANLLMGVESFDGGSLDWTYPNIKKGYLKQSTEVNSNSFDQFNEEIGLFLETSSHLGIQDAKNWSNDRLKTLSGGERTKLALTEIWSQKPDLLILDEPTNHLDYAGIEWLIEQLKLFKGTTILISHDRYFLDQVADVIVEVEHGMITTYNGNYSFYRNEKRRLYETMMHQYEEQKKRERKINEEINRLKSWSDTAHRESTKKEGFKEYWRMKAKKKDVQVKSKIKRLEKMREEGVDKPKDENAVFFEFDHSSQHGKRVLMAENLCKQFQAKVLFQNSHFSISHGEKVGLIGKNGCGKTTLIQMILGNDEPTDGTLWFSPSTKVAYLSQDVLDFDHNESILSLLRKYSRDEQSYIRTLFANIGITSRMIHQPIHSLSLGERVRVKLIFLIIENYNVLILDEPTNHLDLHSREQLENTLREYNGTIILASHDRYLLERVTNKLLVFEDHKIKRIEKGFHLYKEDEQKKDSNQNQAYELMIIQNRITYVLGELSKYNPSDEQYQQLDHEFQELINKKKELMN